MPAFSRIAMSAEYKYDAHASLVALLGDFELDVRRSPSRSPRESSVRGLTTESRAIAAHQAAGI